MGQNVRRPCCRTCSAYQEKSRKPEGPRLDNARIQKRALGGLLPTTPDHEEQREEEAQNSGVCTRLRNLRERLLES